MKKLSLRVEELDVEQFAVEAADVKEEGTVMGRMSPSNAYTDPCRFCPEMPITFTCDVCG